jgi:hypothetical protein
MGESSSRVNKRREKTHEISAVCYFFPFVFRFGLMGLKWSTLPGELIVCIEKGMKGTLQNAVESDLVNLSKGLQLTEFPWKEKKDFAKELFMVITKQAISWQQQEKNKNNDNNNDGSQKPPSSDATNIFVNLLGTCCEAMDGASLIETFEM